MLMHCCPCLQASGCLSVVMQHFQGAYREELAAHRRRQEGEAAAAVEVATALGPETSTAASAGHSVRRGGEPEGMDVDAGAGREGEGYDTPPEPSALRDTIFATVLPSDWQREETEPPGEKAELAIWLAGLATQRESAAEECGSPPQFTV